MARGGARNRSGPAPDPESIRSAKKAAANPDFKAMALPREGYQGEPPAFPMPKPTERELEVWAETWRTPQAAAWALESWRWRTVAQYVRWSVRMEKPAAAASLGTLVLRIADQIGLSPAGLRENGWVVARDEVAARREPVDQPAAAAPRTSARDRMQVVDGAAGD